MINIDALNDEEKLAALESIHKSIAESKEIQRKKITTNVEMIVKALKKIEADLKQRYDETGQLIANLKSGEDGRDGKDGKDGKNGKDGRDGPMGPRGYDGVPGRNGLDGADGVSVTDAHIDFDGSLIIHLSSGRVINVGEVVAADIAEKIKVITNGGGTSQGVLDAIASLQAQIDAIASGLEYQGTWNASTNTPTLASSVGTAGYYYIVAAAGSTNLNGITDWQIGDWAVFNGTIWQKIDQSNLVTSVAGRTGAIVLTTADIGGLGTIATQAANNVSITGGSITGITDLAIADGGTGASTAPNARTNLGATTVGSNVFTLANPSAITFPRFNADNTVSALDAPTFRTAIGAGSGTVTSVAATVPSFLSIGGSPVTSSGTLAITLSGTALPTTSGGTGLTSFTANGVVYASSTSALATGSALTFDGSKLVNTGYNKSTYQVSTGGIGTFESSGGAYLSYLSGANIYSMSDGSGTEDILNLRASAHLFYINSVEQARLTSTGLGLGTNSPGSKLDVKGTLRLSGSTSGYVGLAPAASAGSTTYTLPSADGTANQALVTNGSGTLSWASTATGTVTSVGGTGTVSGISLSGTVTSSGNLTLGGTLDLSAYNGAGAFTTISASGNVTLSGGTANGVAYLNGSKVVTSGSALTFDGSNFKLTGSDNNNLVYSANSNGTTSIRMQSNAAGNYLVAAGADPLYFQNGNASGVMVFAPASSTEQMRLTSTGLGIGTSSPTAKLDVTLSSATAYSSGVTGNGLRLYNSSTTNGQYVGITFLGEPTSGNVGIATILGTTTSSGNMDLTFSTRGSSTLAERMRLDSSGNLGLGVTPSASWGTYKVIQIGEQGVLSGFASGAGVLNIGSNFYWDGSGYRYLTTNPASLYQNNAGAHNWRVAASGTAGNAITWTQAMTLDASGNLLVGKTSGYRGGKLVVAAANVSQTSTLANVHITTTDTQAIDVGGSLGLGGQVGGDETPFGLISGRKENGTSGNYAGYLAFATQASSAAITERARIDSSGNVGIGTTSITAVGSQTVLAVGNSSGGTVSHYQSGSLAYRTSASSSGVDLFNPNASPIGIYTSGTERVRIDSSGNVGIGTSSPSTYGKLVSYNVSGGAYAIAAVGNDQSNVRIRTKNIGSGGGDFSIVGGTPGISNAGLAIFDETNSATRMLIDSSGNLLVGATSGSNHQIKKAVAVGSAVLEVIGNNVGCVFYNGDGGTPNAANAPLKVWSVGATGRSINAAGTINASGADYAEYMTKAGSFTVAKGDVVGIDAQGKLTNVYADAVSFVVKSTDPSYVGNDKWGGGIEGDELEAARQTVDRIAFAGQVPVNVLGASAGQYIIPVNNNGAIKGQAVSNPTFEQYQSSVGKVIAIEADGRARIIVKVA